MQATIEIDPQLLRQAEDLARRKGQAFSVLVEQSLVKTLEAEQRQVPQQEIYGEPLTDEDIADAARVTFRMLDEEESRANENRSAPR